MDYFSLTDTLQSLSEKNPILKRSYLGTSLLGKSIPMLTIGNGNIKVLYIGAHHATEWITSDLLCLFIKDFCEAYENNLTIRKRPVRELFSFVTYTVIPMLNPDGIDYHFHGIGKDNPIRDRVLAMNDNREDFSDWNANGRGVDLNHNYDDCFMEYKKKSPLLQGCRSKFCGEAPESEPEVSYLCRWVRFHEPRGALTLHSQGKEIYWQSRKTAPKNSEWIAKRLAESTGYLLSTPTDTAESGGFTDWCIHKMGIPSFTIECGKGKNPLPIEDLKGIYTDMRQALFLFPTWL